MAMVLSFGLGFPQTAAERGLARSRASGCVPVPLSRDAGAPSRLQLGKAGQGKKGTFMDCTP